MTTAEFLDHASQYVAHWEGFRAHAYWDVNAWRVGYGSDTEGPDGDKVERGTATTPSRAMQNLSLRLGEFLTVCIREVGRPWHGLTLNQQTALIDMCYNYGHIPIEVNVANKELTARRIQACAVHNGGVNRARRLDEASLYVRD